MQHLSSGSTSLCGPSFLRYRPPFHSCCNHTAAHAPPLLPSPAPLPSPTSAPNCDPLLLTHTLMECCCGCGVHDHTQLVDTIFLIVRGKDVNLLHWWHHLSVLMYTWIAVHSNFSPGWAFATVNCFVHCVMYDAGCLRWVRPLLCWW